MPHHQPKDYKLIAIWGKRLGSFHSYIEQQQIRASVQGAPLAAIYERNGEWQEIWGCVNSTREPIEAELREMTGVRSTFTVQQDDEATRDVWVDIAPNGDFNGNVWQRMSFLDKATNRIADTQWRFSPNNTTGFEVTDNTPPPEVISEWQRIRLAVYKAARGESITA